MNKQQKWTSNQQKQVTKVSKQASYKAITNDEATTNKQEVKEGQVEREERRKKCEPKLGVPFYSWRVEGQCELGTFHNPKP